jgi:hypothetical protein
MTDRPNDRLDTLALHAGQEVDPSTLARRSEEHTSELQSLS